MKKTILNKGFVNKSQSEQKPDEWKHRLEIVAEASDQIFYDYNLSDGSILWSGSIEKILGYKPSEMTGGIKQWRKLIHKDDQKEIIRKLKISEKNLVPHDVKYRFKHKDGRYVNFHDKGFFISSPEEESVRMTGVMQDITEKMHSSKLIDALNSAVLKMQKTISRHDIFLSVAEELKKIGINSMIMIPDDELKCLSMEYYSYDSKLMKGLEKVAGAFTKDVKLSIENINEYKEVIHNNRTLLIINSEEFVRQVLPKRFKFMTKQILKTFNIDRFILSPLVIDDKFIGIFSVQSNDFIESDVPTITAFAHQLAGAWYKGELIERIQHEVIKQKQTEEALKESEELFRKVFEESPMAMVMSDEHSNFTKVNETSCRMLGYTEEELKSRKYNHITHPDYPDLESEVEIVRKIKTGEFSHYKIEKPYLTKDKEMVWGSLTLSAIRNDKNEFKYFLAMIEDISERKKNEQELNESSRKINTLINNLPGVVYRCKNDKDWTMEFISNGILQLSGYPPEDFINNKVRTFNSIIIPGDAPSVWDEIQKDIENNRLFLLEYKILCADGSIKWVRERGIGIVKGSKITGLEGYIEDITESKNAEKENILLAQTARSVQDAISLTDLNNKVIFVNDAFLRTYGYSENEILGKNVNILSPKRFSQISDFIHEETMKGTWHGELINLKKDGTEFPIELWTSVVKDSKGNIMATVGVARDITERKRAEKELEEVNKKLVRAQQVAKIGSWEIFLLSDERNWSDNMYEIMGFPKGIKINMEEIKKRILPEELMSFNDAMEEAIRTGKPYSMDYKIMTPDGKQKYIHDEGEIIRDSFGNAISVFGTTQDITEQKNTENALRDSENRLRTLFEAMDDVILVVNKEGRYIEIAPTNPSLLYKPAQEVIGKTVHEIFPKDIADYFYGMIQEAFTSKKPINYEYFLLIQNEIYWFAATLSLLSDDSILLVARDITKRKQTEEELYEKNKELDRYFTSSLDLLCIADTDGYFRRLNPEWEKILGYSQKELMERKFLDFVHPDDLEPTIETISTLLEQKEILNFINRYRCKDGTYRWLEWRSYSEGKLIYAVARDITDGVLAKKALQESEEKMQSIFRVAPTGIGLVKDRIIIDVNPRICEMTGYTLEELIGKNSRIFYPTQEDFDFVGTEKYRQIKEKGTGLVQTKWKKKNGDIINILLASTPLDAKDISKGVIFTVLDITDRIKAEEALNRSENKYRTLFQNSALAIGLRNPDGSYVEFNEAYSKILGYTSEELKTMTQEQLAHPDDIEITKRNMKLVSEGKVDTLKYEKRYIHKNGSTVWAEVCIQPLFTSDKKNSLVIGTVVDITQRKLAEMELIKAKDKAEEMSRIKSSFLANMSHEVRTPLVAILGFSEVLSGLIKDEELKNYVEMIHKGGERLLDTLNLILDLSVIEAQKVKMDLNPLDVVKEVKEVIALFEKSAARKKLKIDFDSKSKSYIIDMDVKMLRQIMNNLINNAIKYTNSGGINVRINEEEREGNKFLAIRIEDTGIGIPKNKQEIIWDEFRQVSEGLNRSFEGAGLGLSITKKFVEKLGGLIYLERSEVDVGSTFTILFPVDQKKEVQNLIKGEGDKNKTDEEKNIKLLPEILYVEDDPISIDIVKAFLSGICYIDGVSSGPEGIEKAKKKSYSAILMDINLGREMNGIQATRAIREIPEYKDIPIVAVTAFAMIGDKEEFFENGCSHYLSKPFSKVELKNIIFEILSKKKQ